MDFQGLQYIFNKSHKLSVSTTFCKSWRLSWDINTYIWNCKLLYQYGHKPVSHNWGSSVHHWIDSKGNVSGQFNKVPTQQWNYPGKTYHLQKKSWIICSFKNYQSILKKNFYKGKFLIIHAVCFWNFVLILP